MQVLIGESGIFSPALPMHRAGPQPSPPAASGSGSHGEWKSATRGEAPAGLRLEQRSDTATSGSCSLPLHSEQFHSGSSEKE